MIWNICMDMGQNMSIYMSQTIITITDMSTHILMIIMRILMNIVDWRKLQKLFRVPK